MRILVDTREQRPFKFTRYDVQVERGTVPTGDYSLPGCEALVAVERKSLDDLVGCLMGAGRDRFEKELSRAGGLESFAVVIEASMDDVRHHGYRSRMEPHAVLQSVTAFAVRYGTSFIWAGSREGAEYSTYWFLQKFAAEQCERLRRVTKALEPV